ncbi:MAG: hypothetical protein M1830_009220 [Pleopsidium flavum]|nr:MAG: hypothetical protein M1830_009220 [Pleopsidium flavum]
MGEISNLIRQATQDSEHGAPSIAFQAIDCNGKVLNSTTSGVRSLDDKHPMTMDTTFWIASCTKMVTSTALMQLVESDQLEEVVPELKEVKIIEGVDENWKPKSKEKRNRITLRMLQTHTGALQLRLVVERAGVINIDWVGVFIERISGLKLGDYFQKYIFEPLGMKNTAFFVNGEMHSRMAGVHQRDEQGNLTSRSYPYKPACQEMKSDEKFHSGGAGLRSTAPDYCQILAAMLNDGVSPTTKARILEKNTIDEMFTPQLPDWESKYAATGYPVTGKQGWDLNFLLESETLQRGSAPGGSTCFWGMDREKGVREVLLSQILPFGEPVVFPLWMQMRWELYA